MLRPEHTTVSRVWCEVAIVALAAFAIAGGCDWFNDPSQINFAPETKIVTFPPSLVAPGDDVTIGWRGSDLDGQIIEYEWTLYESTLDDTLDGTTPDTTLVIAGVEEGSYTFTVASIDNDGEVDASPAECTFTASLGDYVERVVLCELLTTLNCPNCWIADYALVRSLHEFGRENLSVVSYHYAPPYDPLNTQEVSDRCDWYYTFFTIATVFPVTIFDGLTAVAGTVGADTTNTIGAYRMQIEARQAIGSPVSIELDGEIDGGRGSVTATVTVHHQLTGGPHTLRMMVVEDGIDDGERIVNFVVRDILEEEPLTVSAPGDFISVTRDFVIGAWNPQNLDVVAFVQDDTSAEILQSGRLLTEQ